MTTEKNKQDLSSLVELIKKVWEGKDFSFIKKIGDNKLDFTINVIANDQYSAESLVKKLKTLGYNDAEIIPSEFSQSNNIKKVNFTGEFTPADIEKYSEELEIIE